MTRYRIIPELHLTSSDSPITNEKPKSTGVAHVDDPDIEVAHLDGCKGSQAPTIINFRVARLECLRCQASLGLSLPLSVRAFIELIDTFNEAHVTCRPPEKEKAP